MELEAHWSTIRRVCNASRLSSLAFSIVSVNEDGSPHSTPIGSLRLHKECRGTYFELFTQKLGKNLDRDPRVCVMAVNSSKWLWLKSLYKGQFNAAPGVRLYGTVGPRRDAEASEMAWWQRQLKPVRWMKGHDLLWKVEHLAYVRDIHFDRFEPINLGTMTQGLWE